MNPDFDHAREDTIHLGALCHISAFFGLFFPFGNIIGTCIVWALKKEKSSFVDFCGREAMNFQITMSIITTPFAVLACIKLAPPFNIATAGITLGLALVNVILTLIATWKTSAGETYKYPINLRIFGRNSN